MDQQEGLKNQQLTAIQDLVSSIHLTCEKLFREDREHIHLAINDLLEVWLEFTRQIIKNPDALAHVQLVYWQDYLLLCKDLNQRLQTNSTAPVVDAHLQKNTILANFIEKYSFLISQHVQVVFRKVFPSDSADDIKKIEFFTQQFARAFQPATEKYLSISS
jgi:hypothetical protein